MSGFFTGCLFHVEGEGISRVQANLTGGALYRVTFEDGPTDPDDPRMGELASWKPNGARYRRVLRRLRFRRKLHAERRE